MGCKKPSGDPGAIDRAAASIEAYANGVAGIFGSVQSGGSVSLAAAWTGDTAKRVEKMLNDYQSELGTYSRQLHDYAAQLRQYAAKLRKAQSCSIAEILTWVFMIVFTIVEIVVGLFFGGMISAAFTSLASSLMEAVQSSATVARIVSAVSRVGAQIGRLSGFESAEIGAGFIRQGVSLGSQGTRFGTELGTGVTTSVEIGAGFAPRPVVYVMADALSAGGIPTSAVTEGAELLGSSMASGIRSSVTGAVEKVATQILGTFAKNPTYIFDTGVEIGYSAVYNLAEWYAQEVFIRLIASLDPDSEGFTHMWDGETEKTEAVAIFAGMILGSIGIELTKGALKLSGNAIKLADNLLLDNGIDLAESLRGVTSAFKDFKTSLSKVGDDIGGQVEDLLKITGTAGGPLKVSARQLEELTSTTAAQRQTMFEQLATTVEESTGKKIAKDVFKDVLENVWQYGAILALYPAVAGEEFDWKEWIWYVTYGLVEGLTYPVVRHFTRKPVDDMFADLFKERPTFEEDHPLLGVVSENLGDLFVVNGLSILRKITLDPLGGIEGSYTEYLDHIHEAPELEDAELEEFRSEGEHDGEDEHDGEGEHDEPLRMQLRGTPEPRS